ncbi:MULTISPECIES: BMP family ABC transporter substrate-binding protein [Actibacterium]|uniref:Simple sugar transport system substrate-binding protein n=1 Tax=Actibacterium naphthalenivorans TaxID=1614693 RepID=A0A840CC38_9RHOB|nr:MULTISPECIES: BMP family ABC transporter substrate-binding protein [Actibacterium]ALG89281.1 ABC transporter substrate-binding protein [Actibacterium sp. EMB200-NS6]MBB4021118.1 simple sugar transport system substrate-binding protein [Actibacterium naphthalenivorans]
MKFGSILAGVALALGLGGAALAQDKVKVGFVYVGPINDGGWSQHHHESALKMKEHFGDKIDFVFQESVPEGADAERTMTQMALSGADLIFTTSFGYMDPTINVAAKFPDVKFEHATGYKTADNVSVYSARFYEGRAITGFLAGKMTKSNKIGYIASFPIPEVIRGINSTYIHAKKANPDVQLSVIWINTWFDPAKEADATQALLDQGVDVVLAHTDSTAPLAVLEKAGGYGFGQAADMAEYAPAPRISSIIDEWAPYYIDRVQAVIDGTWESVNTWHGIKEGMVGIGEFSEVIPEQVRIEAESLKEAISAGDYHPFTGPLKKQDGTDWLAEGEVADDGTLAGMNFYVEGVTGDIPQ